MLLNKIEGTEFSDNPTEAQRVDSSQIRITNNEELDTVKEKSMYYTGKFEDSFLSASDVSALLAKKDVYKRQTNRILEMIFHLLGGFFSTILVG